LWFDRMRQPRIVTPDGGSTVPGVSVGSVDAWIGSVGGQ
jgi:hypothetical protein